jgi:DNA-directed RNA polymerase subunit omega
MVVSKEVPESQFAYVVVAAKRARQLMAGARPMVDSSKIRKPTRIAEEELVRGLLEYSMEMPGEKEAEEKRRRG